MRLHEYPIFAIIYIARNKIHCFANPIAIHPIVPIAIEAIKIGFLKSFISVIVPTTGPINATIIVTIEAAYPQYAR